MAGVLLGMLLAALDQTIVGTALPRIIAEFNGIQHYAWVVTAYMLASTVMVPIYGKLSDIYGRRLFFLGGITLFLLGSALSGMSQDLTQLILFRGIQGLGAGAMMPLARVIIGDVFPPAERGKWQGLMVAVFGLATIVGPTLGGWITDNWGWRWVFYVNMPVGALAIVTAGIALPGHSRHRAHHIDYLGAATLVAGAIPLLLAFSWAGTAYPWGSVQIIGLLVFAVVMLAIFLFIEMQVPEPIITPSLFKNRVFTVSITNTFLAGIGLFGAVIYLPLFIQGVLGQSATNSGAILTPMWIGYMASSLIGGQLISQTSRYKVLAVASFLIAALGMFLLSCMTPQTSNGLAVRDMVVTGLGLGTMMTLFTIAVQNAFPLNRLGEVTASLQFFRSIGGTIGVALFGTVMTNRFQSAMTTNLPATLKQAIPPGKLASLLNPQLALSPEATARMQASFAGLGPRGQGLFNQLMLTIHQSLATAITDIFLVGAGAMLLGVMVSLFLRELPLRASHQTPAGQDQPLRQPSKERN
jgi:EmrB/QacA subfamily drug resistance transporter